MAINSRIVCHSSTTVSRSGWPCFERTGRGRNRFLYVFPPGTAVRHTSARRFFRARSYPGEHPYVMVVLHASALITNSAWNQDRILPPVPKAPPLLPYSIVTPSALGDPMRTPSRTPFLFLLLHARFLDRTLHHGFEELGYRDGIRHIGDKVRYQTAWMGQERVSEPRAMAATDRFSNP